MMPATGTEGGMSRMDREKAMARMYGEEEGESPRMTITTWPYETKPDIPGGDRIDQLVKAVDFRVDTATLNDEARGALGVAAEEIRDHPDWKLLVVGMGGGLVEHGRAHSLGHERTRAAVHYLTAHGVAASRIHTMDLGRPDRTGNSEYDELAPIQKVEVWAYGSGEKAENR